MQQMIDRGARALAALEQDEVAFRPAPADGVTRSGQSEEHYRTRARAVLEAALMTPPSQRLVLAPNYGAFLNWCRDEQVGPQDRAVRYLSDPTRQLRGAPACAEIVQLEGWYGNPDYRHYLDEIRFMIERHEASPRSCTTSCGWCKGAVR